MTTVNVNGQDCEALSYTVTDANGQTATVSYCLVGDDLKYVVTDAAEGRTIVEYRVTSTTVDQNLFNIPADYQILTQAEFEAAQATTEKFFCRIWELLRHAAAPFCCPPPGNVLYCVQQNA